MDRRTCTVSRNVLEIGGCGLGTGGGSITAFGQMGPPSPSGMKIVSDTVASSRRRMIDSAIPRSPYALAVAYTLYCAGTVNHARPVSVVR